MRLASFNQPFHYPFFSSPMSFMAIEKRALVLVHLFLAASLLVSNAEEDDTRCLMAIKSSIEDPFGYLKSWDFRSNSSAFICKFTGVSCWNDRENKVLSIDLLNLGLKGNFPTGLELCESLTSLDISQNQLSGTIPSNISDLLPYVTRLDLSRNNFSGEIPRSFGNCSYLNLLRLDQNRLAGYLPDEIGSLTRLQSFNVSHNYLSERRSSRRKLEDPVRVGFVFGYSVSASAVFVALSVSWLNVKAVVTMSLSKAVMKISRRRSDRPLQFPTLKDQDKIDQLGKLVNQMNLAELSKATNNFSDDNIIGEGNLGTLYKATLPNGWFLAVKRLRDSPHLESQIVSEMLALAKMRHKNLIPLLGFCIQGNERLLVYKHTSNGNLYDRLQGEAKALQWPLRVKIAVGIARGLAWLHHKCVFRVVHRSISSKAVLLDRNFEPNISNFGCSIISNDGAAMFVYPDENDSGLLVSSGRWEAEFVKKDVYDYGIVLVELITGNEMKTSTSCLSRTNHHLHDTLVELIGNGVLKGAIDKHLIGKGFDEEILQVLRIACECLRPMAFERPKMLKIYERMSNIGQRYGIPCDFGLLLQPRRA